MKFIARQPVFDHSQAVAGYELLFRNRGALDYDEANGEMASRAVLDGFVVYQEQLCGAKKAFINCTAALLMSGEITLLPPDRVVLEVLETAQPEAQLLQACTHLKRAGYKLALDDFVYLPAWDPFLELADIVKIDWRGDEPLRQFAKARQHTKGSVRMLAEKIETMDEFDVAQRAGFDLFQGYFFCRPRTVSLTEIPASKLQYLQIAAAVNREDLDFSEVERIVRSEPSLYYRLLRYLNSPLFAFAGEITSARHAIALLGSRLFRQWTILILMVATADDKPPELIHTALARARFRELLSPWFAAPSEELFLLGLFSVIDALVGSPMKEILAHIPVMAEVKTALLGGQNRLRSIHEFALAVEAGQWNELESNSMSPISEAELAAAYVESLQWAAKIVNCNPGHGQSAAKPKAVLAG